MAINNLIVKGVTINALKILDVAKSMTIGVMSTRVPKRRLSFAPELDTYVNVSNDVLSFFL